MHSDYNNKIEKLFEIYKNNINIIITELNKYINDKKFNEKLKNADFEIQIYNKEMEENLKKILKELNNKITEIIEDFLKAMKCDVELQKYSTIKDMAFGFLGIGIGTFSIIGGGIALGFGIGATSSAVTAISMGLGASLTIPIIGIVIGGLSILGGAGYLIYRLFKKNSTINKEKIDNFKNKNEKEINDSKRKIKEFIEKLINEAIKKIIYYYSIKEDNLDEFRKNKSLFEKYYFEYENIIQQGIGLF
jgi:proline dehydrogenase